MKVYKSLGSRHCLLDNYMLIFQDSCVGDSGSGLMRSRRDPSRGGAGRSELIGVVSFGPRLCGTEGVPGVYSRVESFLPWILDTVENN